MAGAAREEDRQPIKKQNEKRDFKRKNSYAGKNKNLHNTTSPAVSGTVTPSPTTPTSVGSSSSNASFSSGSPGPALPSLRPTPEHIPVNNFNSQEVESYLNTGWKEAMDRFYANSPSEPDKTEMYSSGKAWGPRGGPVWGYKPHLMANGNDFFTELRKSSPNVQVSNAQPATANMKRMSSQRRTKVFGRNRDNNGMLSLYKKDARVLN
ncbi:hypothetical protein Glove_197g49 [Diversispora epigaea]|uniref:Uncharacterized protein n=1 Tax=Diversispora epigaea TaxID=1348612 RepID=A0A397IV55_9GLOM|nr:hypothetical protein Glove_197g49 [Diversispora epigaea]